jgi:CubicO group peptidase (beta-lactamase class C family)
MSDLNESLRQSMPVFAPQKETSYSNVGFDLLGQVISNVTGTSYEDHITKTILNPLQLEQSSFAVPDALVAASAGPGSDWGHDSGSDNP